MLDEYKINNIKNHLGSQNWSSLDICAKVNIIYKKKGVLNIDNLMAKGD